MSVVTDGPTQGDVQSPPTVSERVLVVEDDAAARVGLVQLVKSWGFLADSATDGEDALVKVTSFRPSIVISDLVMPRMDGLALLRALQSQDADVTTLLLTALGTVETAVEAMKEGAYDYLTKPVDIQRLKVLLDKIVERQETLREVKALRRQLREHGTFGTMTGNSPEMRKIYQVIEQAAPTGASVLITGESGTGKELVAQTIHRLSPRASFPFVAINCAAIPETLLESEIFGHEKGAFTGAADRRPGCFELADRGTLFLDEIGEMTPADAGEAAARAPGAAVPAPRRPHRAVGGRARDCRDQHRSARGGPEGQAARGSVLPSERVRDAPSAAARAHGRPAAARAGVHQRVQRRATRSRLPPSITRRCGCSSSTPGRATCASCATSSSGQPFCRRDRSSSRGTCRPRSPTRRRRSTSRRWRSAPGTTVEEAERRLIVMTLEHTRDNKTRAAEILGISLKTLHNKLNKLRLRPRKTE